jgi:dienelactone hydrolase
MRPAGLLLTIILTHLLSDVSAQIVQEFKTTPKSVIGYIEYIPKDYQSNPHNYPVVVFLHGLGQRGPNSTDPAVLKTGYDGLVMYGPSMHVKQGKQFPFILITPQLKSNYGDWPGWYIMEVIEHVKTYLRIDPKRIYLTGSSLGGGGTWIGAQEYPDYFAAVAPVMGSTNTPSKACLIAGSNLPVWAFHSDDDNVVAYSKSVNMVNAINACNPPIKAQLKSYHGYGHNAYTQAYDIGYSYQSPNIYDWMLQWVNDHSNKIPVANAGPEQSVTLPATSISITGNGTDSDGTIVAYRWAQIGGTTATLTNTTTNKLNVSGLTTGIYTFRLVVRDDKGSIASDDVNLYVKTTTNAIPVAKAPTDKTVNLPSNSITLAGSGTDADGYIVSYAWSKLAGGTATLAGTATSTLMVTGMTGGTYVFRLTVMDDNGALKSDDVNVYVNNIPSANAGPDKAITLPTASVTLTGSGSDSDGTISSYAWSKVSGGTALLNGASTANLTVSSLTEGNYTFRLTVKDNRGATKYDDVVIKVYPAVGSNVAPALTVGSDRIISLPANSVTISGTASDPDGTIVAYSWVKLSGGNATLENANTVSLTASSLAAGEYIFQLTVTDNDGASRSDDVKVIVNKSPVVSAGTDRLLSLPKNSIILYGSASDPDGTISSYTWTKISGGSATLTNATTKTLTASGLVAGTYIFRLTAKDNLGATSTDDAIVIVNVPPIANAGANKTVTLPANSVVLSGTGSDPDGTVSYLWTKFSGGVATMSGASTPTLTVEGMAAGVYSFRLTVTDNRGSYNFDDVTVIVNIPPVVNAGADKTVLLPATSTSLIGSATDPDGSITFYSWTKVSGGPATISTSNTPTLSLSGLTSGTYVFRLTAKDDRGALTSDDVTLVVTSSTSGASLPSAAETAQPALAEDEISAFEGVLCPECKIVVFNEKLERIYDDSWKASADDIFSTRGFYYYRVFRDGQIIRTGKIFRQ